MEKSGKKKRAVQNYSCDNGHFFNFQTNDKYTNSFIEWVVFVYLNCLSLNTTIEIIRSYYEDEVLSKNTILEFLEKVADVLPTPIDIDNLFHPSRSGYLALDGVWFKFKGEEIVLLVCFDPDTFDVIDTIWSPTEDEKGYSLLIINVIKKLGLKNIKGVYGDGDKGLINSLKLLLPNVPFQLCIVHKEMRMGQLAPVKLVNISKRMDTVSKTLIKKFQKLYREVIYAKTKDKSLLALKTLKTFTDYHPQDKFKRAFRSLLTNFNYTLTHFDYPDMDRDNNLIECFNSLLKPRLKLMKNFKKYSNLDRYLKLFILDYRFHPLRESRLKERRGLTPLECTGVTLPRYYNFLSFLRQSLNLSYTSKIS